MPMPSPIPVDSTYASDSCMLRPVEADPQPDVLARADSTVEVDGRAVDRKRADRGSHSTIKVEASSLRDVAGHEARERLRRAAADRD